MIDLSHATVTPGLIDCHTHMFLHGINYDEAILKKSQQYRAIWASVAARKTLLAGFTSVRDIETEGGGYGDVALRDAINDGIVIGPRMQCATRALSITGGYSPYGYSPDVDIPKGAQIADGIDGVRKAVREQLANGADLIKIYIDHRRRGTPNPDMLVACRRSLSMKSKSSSRKRLNWTPKLPLTFTPARQRRRQFREVSRRSNTVSISTTRHSR